MSGLQRLHPHLQHAIIHDLGWRSLRPVQDLTIDAVLNGSNVVVLAPTAGGKTEASIFPVLSTILSEDLRPVSALYVCPIRALLNNQEDRLRSYARMVGLDVFKWHGDVSDSKKKTFRATPSHILMTTPESLEVMLMSERTDARTLFQWLSVIIVDEVHAFAADDRGAHLASILERLTSLCGRDIQRIGLSATVGNPLLIGEWLQGSSSRPFQLVDPPKNKANRLLHIEHCEDLTDAAVGIVRIARGKKSLVFVESRSKAEKVAQALDGSGVAVFIHHSSVSRADRTLAEEQFAKGENTAIVCTSTMELGIDVGDLDQVIQLDAPSTVASFLQRLGRTGRRENTRPNCTFFCTTPESLLQSLAILRLAESGWVEDVKPAAQAVHVLAHQIMALILQEDGVSRYRLLPWVEAAFPFSGIGAVRLQELIDTMLERGILYEADGLLSLGQRGEKLYGKKNFFELYAVFTAPPVMRVQHGKEDVGYVQAQFVSMQDDTHGPLCFRLSGRAWEVGLIDWGKGILHVRPADHGRVPSWLGLPGTLSFKLCQSIKDVLLQPDSLDETWLSVSAQDEVRQLRETYEAVLDEDKATLEDTTEGIVWHTFAGGSINRLLAAGLEHVSGKRWSAGNLSLRCKDVPMTSAREAVRHLASLEWEPIAEQAAKSMTRGTVSKFQPCMPEEAENRLLAERLLDFSGTMKFLASNHLLVASSGARGVRISEEDLTELPTNAPVIRKAPSSRVPQNEIRWVISSEALQDAIAELSSNEVIGLDVETSLDFGALCLIQIANRERTFLIDPFRVGELSSLAAIFSCSNPIKVIHHARFERKVLASVGISLDGVFDTLDASRRLRGQDVLGGHSLSMVCERELGFHMDKTNQTSNWSVRPLSDEQVMYAALDAEILLPLYDLFVKAGVNMLGEKS